MPYLIRGVYQWRCQSEYKRLSKESAARECKLAGDVCAFRRACVQYHSGSGLHSNVLPRIVALFVSSGLILLETNSSHYGVDCSEPIAYDFHMYRGAVRGRAETILRSVVASAPCN
jgi:hypothetical protein